MLRWIKRFVLRISPIAVPVLLFVAAGCINTAIYNKGFSDGVIAGRRSAINEIYFEVGWVAPFLSVDQNWLGEKIISWCHAGYHYTSNTVTHQCTSRAIVYNVRHDVIVCKDHAHCYVSSNTVTGVINHYNPKGEK